MDRRDFVTGAALAGAAGVLLGSQPAAAAPKGFDDDVDVLNYALVLEHFLAELYRVGAPLLSGRDAVVVSAIGADEDAHVATLTRAIQASGGEPVGAPAIDLGDALDGRDRFLRLALRLENLFGGAYLDAVGALADEDLLRTATGIFGTEQRHAAVLADLLGLPADGGVFDGAVARRAGRAHVLAQVRPYLGGAPAAAEGAAITL